MFYNLTMCTTWLDNVYEATPLIVKGNINNIRKLNNVSLVTWSTVTFSSGFDRREKVLGCFSSCLSEGE